MNLLIILLILFLALAGMGTIWYITTPKCVLPTLDKNTCGEQKNGKYQQVPVCDPSTNQLVCTDSTDVCGPTTVTGQYCDWNKKKWVTGSGGGGGGGGGGSSCVVDPTTSNFVYPIRYVIQQHEQDYTPTLNSLSYSQISDDAGTYCKLSSCQDGYIIADPNNEMENTCVKNELRYGQTCFDQGTDTPQWDDNGAKAGTKHTYSDPNGVFQNYYDLTTGKRYCQFTGCGAGTGDPCSTSGSCTPDTPDKIVSSWKFNPSTNKCEAQGCNSTTTEKYVLNTGLDGCHLDSCVPGVFTYTVSGDKCIPSGCTPVNGYQPVFTPGDTPTCGPNCKDIATINYFLLGDASKGVSYFQAIPDGKGGCIPTNGGISDYWGGCATLEHTGYSLNKNKDGCVAALQSQFARYSSVDENKGYTPGCMLCPTSRNCPAYVNYDTFDADKGCSDSLEDGCVIAGGKYNKQNLSAIDACKADHSDDLTDLGFTFSGTLSSTMVDPGDPTGSSSNNKGYPIIVTSRDVVININNTSYYGKNVTIYLDGQVSGNGFKWNGTSPNTVGITVTNLGGTFNLKLNKLWTDMGNYIGGLNINLNIIDARDDDVVLIQADGSGLYGTTGGASWSLDNYLKK